MGIFQGNLKKSGDLDKFRTLTALKTTILENNFLFHRRIRRAIHIMKIQIILFVALQSDVNEFKK